VTQSIVVPVVEMKFGVKVAKNTVFVWGPSWSWSYGSWTYNYLCNQCLSSLTLLVRIPLITRCTRCNIMW